MKHVFHDPHYRQGFTVVELVIVITVIAILATISVVGYGAWQTRAAANVLQTDLTNAAAQLQSDLSWSNQYPISAAVANDNKGLPKSERTTYRYTRSLPTSYCLSAFSSRKGVPAFRVTSTDSTPREGACPGHTAP